MARKTNEKLVEALLKTRLPKTVAKTLALILTAGEVRSVDIERATGLRQPEVSIAVKYLRNRGWVSKKDIKKEGKGRPVHIYSLAVSPSELYEIIRAEEEGKIAEIKNNLRVLREYLR